MTRRFRSGGLLGLIAVVATFDACGSGAEPVVVDLSGELPPARYSLSPTSVFGIATLAHVHQAAPTAFGDLDGDGRDDWVTVSHLGVLATSIGPNGIQTLWNHSLDPLPGGSAMTGGVTLDHDVDGDGTSDVVATIQNVDRSMTLILVIDSTTGAAKGRIVLPGGPDHRPDGCWDGGYVPIGAVSIDRRRALILLCGAEYDAEPRGVVAVDPQAVEVLWRFDCGPSVHDRASGAAVVDLDGDGASEIVVGARGTNNCSDHSMGLPDDHSAVYVLAADGRLLWERRFGEPNTGVQVAVADLDDDGVCEIAVALDYWERPIYEISIWGATGRLEARSTFDTRAAGIVAVPTTSGSQQLAVGRPSGVAIYALHDGGLVETRRILTGSLTTVRGLVDDYPIVGPAIVAITGDRGLWLLSPDGALLAANAATTPPRFAFAGESGDWRYLASWGDNGAQLYRAVAVVSPQPMWREWALALLVIATGAPVAVLVRHRRRQRKRTSPNLEAHRRLLDLLQRDRHQRVPVVYRFALLVQRLEHGQIADAAGAMTVSQARTAEAVAEFREHGLSRFHELVRAAGDDLGRMPGGDLLRSVLPTIEVALDACCEASGDTRRSRAAVATLRQAQKSVEAGVETLWRYLIESFEADLGEQLRSLLQDYASVFTQAGIAVIAPDGIARGSLLVHVDPAELTYALDNLVRNATRAMAASPQKRLTISVHEDGDGVYLDVADTGCGVPPERRESIWQDGSGDVAGRARGLPRSRAMLARYGGTLRLIASSPQSGSVFRLALLRSISLKFK